MSDWQGGPKYNMIPRGGNGRKGGVNSGPSGKKARWFNPNVEFTGKLLKEISDASKEYLKVHGRPAVTIVSGLTKSANKKLG